MLNNHQVPIKESRMNTDTWVSLKAQSRIDNLCQNPVISEIFYL